MSTVSIFWHRRDLRLHDNAGLYHALKSGFPVVGLFIFDRHILDDLDDRADRRVAFIHQEVARLHAEMAALGARLDVRFGFPEEIWPRLLEEYDVGAVYANRDYEPYALQRDARVEQLLLERGIDFHAFKDHCIFEMDEVVKDDGKPYTVFTPYSRKWRQRLDSRPDGFFLKPYPNARYRGAYASLPPAPLPALAEMGFEAAEGSPFPGREVPERLLQQYADRRDLPAVPGTSRVGLHLRFGTVSIREMARQGLAHSDKWLQELVWRDFYLMILHHFPQVANKAFRPEYEHIAWRNDEQEFEAWCQGKTGYPLVDAGMRELNATGFMHNRVRMVVASFLTKHLLIDWRWGEAYFAGKLLDFELASNNGGWQWAAGTGCDAAPYFRVFNPHAQMQKFDPQGAYVRKWVPEYGLPSYPKPIVDHALARARALEAYQIGLEAGKRGAKA
jgi:deoxyribodipyrimidine photo-lyase